MSLAICRLPVKTGTLVRPLLLAFVPILLCGVQPVLADVLNVDDGSYKAEVEESATPVFIDFYATWCGPCKTIAPAVDELSDQYRNTVKFVRVDVDKAPKTAERYGIEPLPTLVVRSKKVSKGFALSGVQSKEAIKKFIDESLKKL
ncbi:MAG: thioredoxin [Cyanobacteria bacterium REEB67]|nr:thioredoxin [Cyanobacteria bacterium REEB67]